MPLTRTDLSLDINSKVVDSNINVPGRTLGKNDRLNREKILDYVDQQVAAAATGDAAFGFEFLIVSAAGTAIPAPVAGKLKAVRLNVAADTTFTGLPVATGSGKGYFLRQSQDFPARFDKDIDDTAAGDPLFTLAGQSALIIDVSAGVYVKFI